MNIILLGAPFSGKGTLAKKIVKDFNLAHISVGDLFRENINKGTDIGKIAKGYIDNGQLVPDGVTIPMLEKKLLEKNETKGYILDGFPRTIEQAEALEKVAKVDTVIMLDVSFDEIKRRCLCRRVCSKCGEIYSTATYDKAVCMKCNSPLFQRDDDNLESINTRLEVYKKITTPLINFYADRLFVVNGGSTPEETYEPVKNFLKGFGL